MALDVHRYEIKVEMEDEAGVSRSTIYEQTTDITIGEGRNTAYHEVYLGDDDTSVLVSQGGTDIRTVSWSSDNADVYIQIYENTNVEYRLGPDAAGTGPVNIGAVIGYAVFSTALTPVSALQVTARKESGPGTASTVRVWMSE